MFKQMTGTDIKHIPYKGSVQAINAVMAGDVQMTIVDSPPVLPHVKAKQLKGLAVTSAKRAESAPELPTLAEAGVPGYEMNLWIGAFAPAGTPGEIASRLTAEVARIVRLPDVREKLAAMGVQAVGNTSEQFAEMIKIEIAKFGPVVRAANIKAD